METLIEWDKELFLYLNNLGSSSWDQFWMIVTDKKTWIWLYAIFLFLFFRMFGWKKTAFIVGLTLLMILATDQITNLFKNDWVQRFRPCKTAGIKEFMRLVKSYCGGDYGFFSGHASNHFALAFFLGRIFYRKYKFVFYLLIVWAAIIAYSRVYIGVHYPLDILCGAIFGTLMGTLFYFIFTKLENHPWVNKQKTV